MSNSYNYVTSKKIFTTLSDDVHGLWDLSDQNRTFGFCNYHFWLVEILVFLYIQRVPYLQEMVFYWTSFTRLFIGC